MAQGWEETDKNARPIIYIEVAAGAQKQNYEKERLHTYKVFCESRHR